MAKLRVSLTPAIGRLQIVSRNIVDTRVIGNYKSVFKGRGLEFANYRDYTENDDASLIDWKASARANNTLVKEYVEERNVNVFFLIDVSSSMVFGSTPKLKNEYAAELAAALCYTSLEAGDSVGYALFSDKIVKKMPPKLGPQQYYSLSKIIVNPSIYGGGVNFGNALKFLLTYLKQASIVIIISDFIGLKGDWQHYLKIIAHKFDTIGMMVRDPHDKYLPDVKGNIVFQDPFSEKQLVINVESARDDYRRYVARQEAMVRDTFLKSRADFLSLTTDKPFIKPIMDFFIRRTKMMR